MHVALRCLWWMRQALHRRKSKHSWRGGKRSHCNPLTSSLPFKVTYELQEDTSPYFTRSRRARENALILQLYKKNYIIKFMFETDRTDHRSGLMHRYSQVRHKVRGEVKCINLKPFFLKRSNKSSSPRAINFFIYTKSRHKHQ